MQGDFLHRP